jgi:hypothetical protein
LVEYLGETVKVTRQDGSTIEGECVSFESSIESVLETDCIDIQQDGYREAIPACDILDIEVIHE